MWRGIPDRCCDDARMRRRAVPILALVVLLGACSSGKKAAAPTTTTATTRPTVATSTTGGPTTTAPVTSTTTAATSTTAPACPSAGSTAPRSTAARQPSALLTDVAVSVGPCVDRVVLTFRTHGTAAPSCAVEYRAGPFSQDGSGAPVAVAGAAFAAIRCEPATGYDFERGAPSYTGPKRLVPPRANHVRELVETGDFEGVVTWIVGLDGQRPFVITATGAPVRQLVVTFS